jgi:hypothetical protein
VQIRLHKRQMGTYIHGQRGWMDGASEVTGAQIIGVSSGTLEARFRPHRGASCTFPMRLWFLCCPLLVEKFLDHLLL